MVGREGFGREGFALSPKRTLTNIAFFDANCQFGRHNQRHPGAPYALADLVADMHRHGIARRLVHHAMAKENSTTIGNARLMEEIKSVEGLAPCWAVSTWVTGEMPRPSELVTLLKANKVRAVRFFCHYYHVPTAEWSLGLLWSELEAHRIPLILDGGDHWADIRDLDTELVYQLCHAHPNLPVIYTEHRIRFNRQVYQLLEACPNLHLELSGYWHYRAVEDICRRFGAERLIFGTNWPYMDSGFAVAMVTYAQVSDTEKAAVAGGNLSALLEAVQW